VVTADVPPCTIVGGNPARALRARYAPDVAKLPCELAWRDKPVEWISAHLHLITGADPDALRAAARG
jgi:virginiamycin A acetyltransferase